MQMVESEPVQKILQKQAWSSEGDQQHKNSHLPYEPKQDALQDTTKKLLQEIKSPRLVPLKSTQTNSGSIGKELIAEKVNSKVELQLGSDVSIKRTDDSSGSASGTNSQSLIARRIHTLLAGSPDTEDIDSEEFSEKIDKALAERKPSESTLRQIKTQSEPTKITIKREQDERIIHVPSKDQRNGSQTHDPPTHGGTHSPEKVQSKPQDKETAQQIAQLKSRHASEQRAALISARMKSLLAESRDGPEWRSMSPKVSTTVSPSSHESRSIRVAPANDRRHDVIAETQVTQSSLHHQVHKLPHVSSEHSTQQAKMSSTALLDRPDSDLYEVMSERSDFDTLDSLVANQPLSMSADELEFSDYENIEESDVDDKKTDILVANELGTRNVSKKPVDQAAVSHPESTSVSHEPVVKSPEEGEQVVRRKKKDSQNDDEQKERRRSIKELVSSFESQISPFFKSSAVSGPLKKASSHESITSEASEINAPRRSMRERSGSVPDLYQ